jgi:DNA-directed RNA polymerase specialized sigma subunit
VVDYEKEADEMIDHLIELRVEIEGTIDSVRDEKLREVLERRYLYFETWKQIAANMKYSVRTIYRLHDDALKVVSECHRMSQLVT